MPIYVADDDDIKRGIPCYPRVLKYLGTLLSNSIPQMPPNLLTRFDSAQDMWNELRHQLAAYVRHEYPFNHSRGTAETPWRYWKALSHHDSASILSVRGHTALIMSVHN